MSRFEVCGCGGEVPAEDGPVHAYMASAPACWRMYGEVGLRVSSRGQSNVDCYAAQHTGGADVEPRQRNSVAVHLVALCLRLEHDVRGPALMRARGRTSEVALPALGLDGWPVLDDPPTFGPVTVPALHTAADIELPDLVAAWPAAVWDAWQPQHDTVRSWTEPVLRSLR